jgi:(p)ppGpp synthase/HD superfamily hydrolase
MIEAALLHDVLEDTATTFETLHRDFGGEVAFMVFDLSDQIPKESGNRAFRKRAEADRLGQCSAAVQTIKVADLIDNTLSIVAYDPGFAKVYLAEKAYLLQRLTKADPILVRRAQELVRHHATDTVTSSTGRQ